MFNPFIPFSFGYITLFPGRGHRYMVAQSFPCDEASTQGKKGLLLTPYSDQGLALIHLQAVRTDALSCILDLNKELHSKKVEQLIDPLSEYSVWAGVVSAKKEVQERIEKRYAKNIRRYIQNNTTWRFKGDSTFNMKMLIKFGEVYLHMKYNQYEEIQERLEVIAKN